MEDVRMVKVLTAILDAFEGYALAEANDKIREKFDRGEAHLGIGGGMCLYDNEIAEVIANAKRRTKEMFGE